MKDVLEPPAGFKRFCYHKWVFLRKNRYGEKFYKCAHCGEVM